MATPQQKSGVRPISFVYHNMASGLPPYEHKLVIRPEELTRQDNSRITTHQTLGGAWSDNFGPGVPTVTLAGTTGWGSGGLPDGQQAFLELYDMVYVKWHKARAALVESGEDPDQVKLIFRDVLDNFTWVVAPTQFVLQRSKSRPLLSQYRISLTRVSEDVSETMAALSLTELQKQKIALSSLDATLQGLQDFAASLGDEINAYFGPLQHGIVSLVNVTNAVLKVARSLIADGFLVVDAVSNNVMALAAGLTIAASNVFATVIAVQSIPGRIQARITRARTLFLNAFCIIQNTLKTRKMLPDFDDVYGASLCSSTAGGRPLSQYLNSSNTFDAIMPIIKSNIAVTQESQSALMGLRKTDPVLSPMSLSEVGALSSLAASGVVVG